MKVTTKLLSLLLALCLLLASCAPAITPKSAEVPVVTPSADGNISGKTEVDDLSREELETVVGALDEDIDTSKMTDKELSQLAQGLLNGADKDNAVDNSDAYDENGAMVKPFDQVYPDVVEGGLVEYSDESLLVKMSNAAGGKISAAMAQAGVAKLEAIVPLEQDTWYKVSLVKGTDAKTALEALRGLKEVRLAEYDYKIKTSAMDDYQDIDADFGFENNHHKKDQWYLHHCGIPEGFNYMKYDGGQPSVIVAVIDTGVDIDHEDLAHNIWKNTAEKPGDGIDNDGNGYIDDYYGVNIVSGKGNGDDDNGHGTHVAGIIAARNNNIGTVGIAHKVTVMPVKAAAASGYFLQSDIAKAVLYAYENGAEVINMSFGGAACSIAVQDALATAYTRCVLVASAGNDGLPNEGMGAIPNYPAALTYVLGVMAVDQSGRETYFTNWDVKLYNGVEYELYAPGYQIMSTLPDNRYGSLSGTSMAAPVVSAFAAILRSEFADRDTYPTKFIYGQLTSTSEHYATCLDPETHGEHNLPQIVDLHAALTKLPKPDIGVQDFLAFDTVGLSQDAAGKNNGDGVIDAGETLSLGLILRNRWGMSKNTKVTLDTLSGAGLSDPYVTFVNPTVNYDTVGTYSTQDCGKLYTDELHTGWENPFIVRIAPDCPNDYIVQVNVRLQYENGLDDNDKTVYTNEEDPIVFTFTVRNGVILPSIIDEDMTLTPDNLYIIPNSTVITAGTTVRVRPGTHIQFWSDDPSDPYADTYIAYLSVKGRFLVEGTKENPVYIYPSDLMDMYNVEFGEQDGGYISLKYADVTNLAQNRWNYNIGCKISYADHCTFRENYGLYKYGRVLESGVVRDVDFGDLLLANFGLVENSVFYKLGHIGYNHYVYGNVNRCIFADCGLTYGNLNNSGPVTLQNCVFLGNTFYDQTVPDRYENSAMTMTGVADLCADDLRVTYDEETGTTYVVSPSDEFDSPILEKMGARPLIVQNESKWQSLERALRTYQGNNVYTYALEYIYRDGVYCWYDGTPIGAFLDTQYRCLGEKHDSLWLRVDLKSDVPVCTLVPDAVGIFPYYIYEVPGRVLPTDITFDAYEVVLDTGATYQLAPQSVPVQLNVSDFIYESRDESVVKVNADGLVAPVGKGTADVYIYSHDRAVYNYVTFTVADYVALEDFTFSAAQNAVAVGETVKTSLTFAPADTTRKQVTYVSSAPGVVAVDAAGNLTGLTSGTATVTATCEGISKTVQVRSFVKASKVEISMPAISMTPDGGAKDLPSVIINEGAEVDLVWRSVDTTVVAVENGKLVPKAAGTSTVVVTDRNSGLSTSVLAVVGVVASSVKEVLGAYVLLENGNLYLWNDTAQFATLVTTGVKDVCRGNGNTKLLKNDNSGYNLFEDGSISSAMSAFDFFKEKNIDIKKIDHYGFSSNNWYALTENGTVYAWGTNEYGELGIGTAERTDTPTLVNLDNVVDVCVAQYNVVYFLTADGKYYYAGQQSNGAKVPTLIADGVEKILYNGENVLRKDGSIVTYKRNGTVYYSFTPSWPEGYGSVSAGAARSGACIADGKVYIYSEGSPIKEVPGISNAIYVYANATTYYIATADGLLYKYANNILTLIRVEQTDETPQVLSSSQQGNTVHLVFNKELLQVKPLLFDGDFQITVQYAINNCNELVISRAAGFEDGVEYRVVFEAGAIHCAGGVTNSEEMTVTFEYEGEQTPDKSEGEQTPEIVPVVHQSVTDTSVERVLTPESFVAKYKAARDTYQINSIFYNNAILNRVSTDSTVEHWLRPLAPSGSGAEIPFGQNYWGTVNERAIELQMIDYSDFITYSRLVYAPYLTAAPEDTFPFVTSVKVLNKHGEEVTSVGNEQITVRVTFNRDMDTSIPLWVRFGSAYPYGDYEVEGKYVNARTWEGKYKLTTVIEGGIQYFTIENGCSATDDLVLMRDRARFAFEIDTTAAQALIMQGEATDTGIALHWTQDDFDTLMGYNVYRSTALDGLYSRINTSVIPADTMSFFDDTVEPGVQYYYNFTVVQTDLSESIPSGKIVIMSKDTMAPNVYHSPVYDAETGKNLIISATVTDNLNIVYARVYYRTKGENEWRIATMNKLNDKYSAIVIANHVSVEGLEYYIEAFDGVSCTYKGSAENPYLVAVREAVSGDALGDVNGDGAITNLDALMLLKAINHQLNLTAEQLARADLNGNGLLEAKEALRILHYVSGVVGSVDMRS